MFCVNWDEFAYWTEVHQPSIAAVDLDLMWL